MQSKSSVEATQEDIPLSENHLGAHTHRVKTRDRDLDCLEVIFFEGVSVELFSVDLETNRAIHD